MEKQENIVRMEQKDQDESFMLPTVDFCFKELMGDEMVRAGFIAAVLHIPPEEIKYTQLLATNLSKGHSNGKLGILDVRVEMQDSSQIDLEMQVESFECWSDRTVFYLSKMFTEQIKAGDKYETLVKCIHIGILDFIIYPETDSYYSQFHIREDDRGSLYTDKMEFHILELPKLKLLEEPKDDLELWVKFLGGKNKEDFMKMASRSKYIEKAYQILQIISSDKNKRWEYEAREKAIRDYNHQIHSYTQKGIREGLEQGLKLAQCMIKDNREEELKRSFTNKKLQSRLLKEYKIE